MNVGAAGILGRDRPPPSTRTGGHDSRFEGWSRFSEKWAARSAQSSVRPTGSHGCAARAELLGFLSGVLEGRAGVGIDQVTGDDVGEAMAL
jgi:hypothetical protein